jgi:hypothetical protein
MKEAHPYSMNLAYNLARLEKIRNQPEQALFYLEEIEKIAKFYQAWPETKSYQLLLERVKKQP